MLFLICSCRSADFFNSIEATKAASLRQVRDLLKHRLLQPLREKGAVATCADVISLLHELKMESSHVSDLKLVCSNLESLDHVSRDLGAESSVRDTMFLTLAQEEAVFLFLAPNADSANSSGVQLWLPSFDRAKSMSELLELQSRLLLSNQSQDASKADRIAQFGQKVKLVTVISTLHLEYRLRGGRRTISLNSLRKLSPKAPAAEIAVAYAESTEVYQALANEVGSLLKDWATAVGALRTEFKILNQMTAAQVFIA